MENVSIPFAGDSLPPEVEKYFDQNGLWLRNKVAEDQLYFCWEEGRLKLKQENLPPLEINLQSQWNHHQEIYRHSPRRNEPFYKALKNPAQFHVFDATCGLMKDSLLMLFWGAKVTACERSPYLAALILDSLRFHQELANSWNNRFEFKLIDAKDELLSPQNVDIIYLDPMFEEHSEKALPSKNMQYARSLLGHPDLKDSLNLLELARKQNCQRVLVKRTRKAAPLKENPDFSYSGKNARYDCYLPLKNLDSL